MMDNQTSSIRTILPETAEGWYVVNQRDDLSEDECLAFLAWLEEDVANQQAYDKVEMASALMTEAASNSAATFKLGMNNKKRQNALPVFAFAASSAFLFISVSILLNVETRGDSFNTSVGEQHTVALEDGSLMKLNTATSLTVDFDETERRIILNAGEAYFDVQKDGDGRPFFVEAGDVVVRVIGTDFNVHRTTDETVIDVLEGLVRVTQKKPVRSAQANMFEVPEGRRISIDANGVASEILPVEAGEMGDWLDGRLDFDADPLSDVVSEFNRYAKVQLIIADESLDDLEISGSFTIGRSEEFARGLEAVYSVDVVKEGHMLVLTKKSQSLMQRRSRKAL